MSFLITAAALAASVCNVEQPVLRVVGEDWYSDPAGSVVDEAAFTRHQANIEPLRRYATELTTRIDRGDLDCASHQLATWAAAGAMLLRPPNFAGQRERLRFAVAITLSALRLQHAGRGTSPEVLAWIGRINRAAAYDLRRRALVDNLYVWAGTTAALGWKVTRNAGLLASAKRMFESSTRPIRTDGFIPSELRRQSRSLLYHGYYLSGLLVLRTIVGSDETQKAAVSRLQRAVWRGSCAPKTFPSELSQASINKNDLAIIAVLGARGEEALLPCGLRGDDYYDPLRGGDMRELRKILSKAY